jgi:hypothetical protein
MSNVQGSEDGFWKFCDPRFIQTPSKSPGSLNDILIHSYISSFYNQLLTRVRLMSNEKTRSLIFDTIVSYEHNNCSYWWSE